MLAYARSVCGTISFDGVIGLGKGTMTAIGAKSIKTRWRKRTVIFATQTKTASQAIGSIHRGMDIYGVTFGQFSFIHIIEDVIRQIDEPVSLDVASWTIAKFEAAKLLYYIENEYVERLRVMLDSSISSLNPSALKCLANLQKAGRLRLLRCHCKFAVISSETWNISIHTSMNLNQNKRLENFEISDCEVLATFMRNIVSEIFASPCNPQSEIKLNDIAKEFTLDDLLSD